VKKEDNIKMIADLGSAAVLGFVLGPLVGLVATVANFNFLGFEITAYSACGYLQAIFSILMLAASMIYFNEIPRKERINYMPKSKYNSTLVRESDET